MDCCLVLRCPTNKGWERVTEEIRQLASVFVSGPSCLGICAVKIHVQKPCSANLCGRQKNRGSVAGEDGHDEPPRHASFFGVGQRGATFTAEGVQHVLRPSRKLPLAKVEPSKATDGFSSRRSSFGIVSYNFQLLMSYSILFFSDFLVQVPYGPSG